MYVSIYIYISFVYKQNSSVRLSGHGTCSSPTNARSKQKLMTVDRWVASAINSAVFKRLRVVYSELVRVANVLLGGTIPSLDNGVSFRETKPLPRALKRLIRLISKALFPFILDCFMNGCTLAPTTGSGQESSRHFSNVFSIPWHHACTALRRKRWNGEAGSEFPGSGFMRKRPHRMSTIPTSDESERIFFSNLHRVQFNLNIYINRFSITQYN